MNTCATAMRLGDLPKVLARNPCAIHNAGSKREIFDIDFKNYIANPNDYT